MLVVGNAAHNRIGPQIGNPQPVAEQRAEHFGIEESSAIQQRKDEIDTGIGEQRIIAVRDLQLVEQTFKDHAHFMMVGGMIAIDRIKVAIAERMLGNEQQPEVAPCGIRQSQR